MTVVVMVASVGDYVAGESYEIPDETADRFVILGYANGDLSRGYSDDEVQEFLASKQEVSLGG